MIKRAGFFPFNTTSESIISVCNSRPQTPVPPTSFDSSPMSHQGVTLAMRLATVMVFLLASVSAFSPSRMMQKQNSDMRSSSSSCSVSSSTALWGYHKTGRAASRGQDRSKRQYRVGQLVQSELGRIIHTGLIKGDVDHIDEELRRRISVVSADVSPDLRQARVTVSVRKSSSSDNPVVDKRRAYSWLVQNTKMIRHTLAQRMSHMKTSPDLTFIQVDIGAAVDVMYLIDKVSSGYERERIGDFGENDSSVPQGSVGGMDFDEAFDEDEWDEEDEDFFDDSE
jgi:ribosome-binding factor A